MLGVKVFLLVSSQKSRLFLFQEFKEEKEEEMRVKMAENNKHKMWR